VRAVAQAPDPVAAGPDAALIDAAARGDAPAVARLLAAGASPKARDARGRTAPLAATQGNHPEAARRLLEAGAEPNVQDAIGDSAFLLAGAREHVEILRMTIAAGAR
jgi:ankyrin repeat protein